jgi:hypothetical protein
VTVSPIARGEKGRREKPRPSRASIATSIAERPATSSTLVEAAAVTAAPLSSRPEAVTVVTSGPGRSACETAVEPVAVALSPGRRARQPKGISPTRSSVSAS